MNKTELLLQMMEHPHEYTADEWQQTLHDEACREVYTLMSKTRSAFDSARADEQITDETVDDEWQRFVARHPEMRPHSSLFSLHPLLHKMAASFIGLLVVSGIAFAAIHIVHQYRQPEVRQVEQTASPEKTLNAIPADTLTTDTASVQPVVFDNVFFEDMLDEIAEYYQMEADFQNEAVRQLRFYFVWYQNQPLDKVVETLNHFERVNITMDDKKLVVR